MRSPLLAVPLLLVSLSSTAQGPLLAPRGGAFSAGGCDLGAPDGGDGLRGRGPGYDVSFTAGGVQFALAPAATEQQGPQLHLLPVSVRAGARVVAALPSAAPPEQVGTAAHYRHAPGVTERWDLRRTGVELSWRFEQPLGDGDLVVRYAVNGALAAPVAADGGLEFAQPVAAGAPPRGIRIGKVTGVDARGATVAGTIRAVSGVVELVLPAAFVAAAVYPLVLDPTIGAIVPIVAGAAGLTDNADPDAAFDASTSRFLTGWHHAGYILGTWFHDVQLQRINAGTGALVGAMIPLGASGVPSGPRIANLGTRNRFGVVWTQLDGVTSSVKFAAVDAATGAITHTFTVASSTTSTYSHADIGCETAAPIGAGRGFVLVWEDDGLDAIRARRIWFSAADALGISATFSVLTDTTLGSSYTTPAISRTAGPDGKLLVVVRRDSVLFGGQAIFGAVVDTGNSTVGPTGTIYSNSSYDASAPDVDGYGGRWVAVWQRDPVGGADARVVAAPVLLDVAAAALNAGSGHIFGSVSAPAQQPSVGYTPGKTWLTYRSVVGVGFPPTTLNVSQVVTGLDAGSCLACNDVFTQTATVPFVGAGPATPDRVTVATMTSGGATSGENAFAVWSVENDVNGQLLRNHSLAGGISNLGGGCGAGGTQAFSHSPAIGSSGLVCTVNGLSGTALATVFNFSASGQPLPCGPCQWRPFVVTLTPPIVAGSASVEFPIPCLATLVGAVFETQWTTVDFAQAPCPTFPGLSLSPRMALQIGP